MEICSCGSDCLPHHYVLHLLSPPEPVDMFADAEPSSEGVGSTGDHAPSSLETEVMWEYKWKNEEGDKVHGPFTSTQMLQWVNEG